MADLFYIKTIIDEELAELQVTNSLKRKTMSKIFKRTVNFSLLSNHIGKFITSVVSFIMVFGITFNTFLGQRTIAKQSDSLVTEKINCQANYYTSSVNSNQEMGLSSDNYSLQIKENIMENVVPLSNDYCIQNDSER